MRRGLEVSVMMTECMRGSLPVRKSRGIFFRPMNNKKMSRHNEHSSSLLSVFCGFHMARAQPAGIGI
jgi:hypothetical protein